MNWMISGVRVSLLLKWELYNTRYFIRLFLQTTRFQKYSLHKKERSQLTSCDILAAFFSNREE